MDSRYAILIRMGPHAEVVLGVRATRTDRDAAHAAAEAQGWKLQELVTACLRAVVANPKALFAVIADYRPAPKPAGRPRKVTPPAE